MSISTRDSDRIGPIGPGDPSLLGGSCLFLCPQCPCGLILFLPSTSVGIIWAFWRPPVLCRWIPPYLLSPPSLGYWLLEVSQMVSSSIPPSSFSSLDPSSPYRLVGPSLLQMEAVHPQMVPYQKWFSTHGFPMAPASLCRGFSGLLLSRGSSSMLGGGVLSPLSPIQSPSLAFPNLLNFSVLTFISLIWQDLPDYFIHFWYTCNTVISKRKRKRAQQIIYIDWSNSKI